MAIPFNLPSDEETENNYRSMDELLLQLYHVLRQILLHRAAPEGPRADAGDDSLERNNSRPTPSADAAPRPAAAAAATPRLPLPDLVQSTAPTTPSRPVRQRAATATSAVPLRSPSHPLPPPRRTRRRRSQQHPYPRGVAAAVVVAAAEEEAKTAGEAAAVPRREECTRDAGGVTLRAAYQCVTVRDCARPNLLLTKELPPKVETRDNWSQVGEDLRHIADEFHASLQDFERSKAAACVASHQKSAGLLSLLVPAPFSGSVWMAVIFLLGWGVLQRSGR